MPEYGQRLFDELTAVGLAPTGITDGEPVFPRLLSPEEHQLLFGVKKAHVADDAVYAATDLANSPLTSDLRALLGVPSSEWSAYLTLQTDMIRNNRRTAYQEEADPIFFDAEADSTTKTAWLAKRTDIKERFPWPGDYR